MREKIRRAIISIAFVLSFSKTDGGKARRAKRLTQVKGKSECADFFLPFPFSLILSISTAFCTSRFPLSMFTRFLTTR
jgi:hypothetical protein